MKTSPKPKAKPLTPISVSHAEIEQLREKASELVLRSPDKAAIILTDWLRRPAKKSSRSKKSA